KARHEESQEMAVAQGMRTLRDSGIQLVADDVTTISEILRNIYVICGAMASFRYQGTTEAGNRTRGVTQATSLKTAMAGLVEQGFTVSQLKPKRSVLKFEITKEKLPQGELMHFSRQLSAFVRAGIPLIEALEVIEEEADD